MLLNSDLCVGAIANHVGISIPAVSQHLRILRKAGLVRGEKRGYWTHYKVDRQAIFLKDRRDYFVATLILGITLASNLAAGFIAGMIVARLLKWEKLSV